MKEMHEETEELALSVKKAVDLYLVNCEDKRAHEEIEADCIGILVANACYRLSLIIRSLIEEGRLEEAKQMYGRSRMVFIVNLDGVLHAQGIVL